MVKVTARMVALGGGAALLAGLAGLAADGTAVASAGAAAPAGSSSGWHRYQVPVKGQANLLAAAAPGRGDAWAAGFTIHLSQAPAAAGASPDSPVTQAGPVRAAAPRAPGPRGPPAAPVPSRASSTP